MDLDLRLVRYFVAVADELHFGRAAASLYLSQPALSKQIRRLEEDVGFALFERDSRHVALTPRGEQFLADARQLLATAQRMVRMPDADVVRMAHIFELDTGRRVVDAFRDVAPHVRVVETQMDSARQLEALMTGGLDVAILRVTAAMATRFPTGWDHRLLRLEPFWLVGRAGDAPPEFASLMDRPVEVFADASDSPTYNSHGEYMTSLQRQTGLALAWLGNPGAFENCYAILSRSPQPGYLLEFDGYARKYPPRGLPIFRPRELQPVYPWSIAWREEPPSEAVRLFIGTAIGVAKRWGWTRSSPGSAPLWVPGEDPLNDDERTSAVRQLTTPNVVRPHTD